MEPFIIQCPTCGSSIRIKNAALVGQIANCPKCQSLLQIAPPTANSDGHAAAGFSADSSALTRESIPANVDVDRPMETDPGSSHAEGDEYRLAPGDAEEPNFEEPSFEESVSAWQPADAPLVPTEDWTSESSNKTKQYLLVGVLGFTGLLLAVGGFFAFLSWYNKPDTPIAQVDPATGEASKPGVQGPANRQPSEQSPAAEDNQPAEADNGTPATSPETPIAQDLESAAPPAPANPEADPNVDSPPDVDDPNGDGSSTANDDSNASDDSADAGTPEETVPEGNSAFNALSSILDVDINPTIPDESVELGEPPVTAEELGLRTSITRPPLQPIDVSQQLETPLGGLVLTGKPLPLSRWINTWSHLSGVPTVIDFDQFAAAGIDTDQKFQLPRSQDITLGEYLKLFSTALGVEAQAVQGRYCILRPQSSTMLTNLPESLPLGGVVEESQTQWLTELLQRWFPASSGKLNVEAGELKFENHEADLATWIKIVRLVRSLRAAKLGTSTGDALATQFVRENDVAGLASKCTIVTGQSRPVGQMLSRVAGQGDLDLWIDWANVGEIGLGPGTSEAVITQGRSIARILTDYAVLFKFEVVIIDEQTLWITSSQAYRSQVQSYALPAAGKTAEEWQSQLRALTPAANPAGGVGMVLAELTPDEDFVIIRSCRPRMQIVK